MQMDRGWINSRLFSKAHQDGVSEFMKFVSERFGDDEEIICPCRQCLNQVFGHRGLVQDLLYIHGMYSTDDKWIHHGEPSDAEINDNFKQRWSRVSPCDSTLSLDKNVIHMCVKSGSKLSNLLNFACQSFQVKCLQFILNT